MGDGTTWIGLDRAGPIPGAGSPVSSTQTLWQPHSRAERGGVPVGRGSCDGTSHLPSVPPQPSCPTSISQPPAVTRANQQPHEQAPYSGQWLIPGLGASEVMRPADRRTSGITRGSKSQNPIKSSRNHLTGLHHDCVASSWPACWIIASMAWCIHSLETSRQRGQPGSLTPSLQAPGPLVHV